MSLDSTIQSQLQTVFSKLENTVELVVLKSAHPDQKELLTLLNDVKITSEKIQVSLSENEDSDSPEFYFVTQGKKNGIRFKGIPNGHEFSSLILAILNSDNKGKMPDEILQKRIRKLKKGIHIKTFMSLTCENCPDVVQSLNQIAIIHGSLTHEIIDGNYAQDQIERLGIQGVPSLASNEKMFHSGRISLIDLIQKIEAEFGTDANTTTAEAPTFIGHYNVLVVGGGPAGASAAIYTVRKGMSTAMITDKIGGQVKETKGIENLISVTYTEGPQLSAQLYQHVTSYPIQLLENRRVSKILKGHPKRIELETGEYLTADSIVIATGAKWKELNIPGEKEYLGRGVAFCPHCDGPFYKGKNVSVIGGGNSGVEAAIDLAGIVKHVTLLEFNSSLKADKILVDKLLSLPNVSVLTNAKTQKFIGDGQKISSLEYQDRQTSENKVLPIDGIFIQIGLVPNSQFLKESIQLTKYGEIIVDEKGRTSEPGIYAAGDVTTTPYKQIIIAMGEGAKTGLAVFEDRMLHAPAV